MKNFEDTPAVAIYAVRDIGIATALRLAEFGFAIALAKDRAAH